jgi:hypothetical protein
MLKTEVFRLVAAAAARAIGAAAMIYYVDKRSMDDVAQRFDLQG